MKEVMIKATGLEKSFKKTEVLKGVDFEVKHGEIFALLGSNGAGKTTTIQILATLLKADNGNAHISGFDVKRSRKKYGNILALLDNLQQ